MNNIFISQRNLAMVVAGSVKNALSNIRNQFDYKFQISVLYIKKEIEKKLLHKNEQQILQLLDDRNVYLLMLESVRFMMVEISLYALNGFMRD